jgi:hypothetical protein
MNTQYLPFAMFLGFGLILFVAALAWRNLRGYFVRKGKSSRDATDAPRHHHASVKY